ncbi:carotenoid biosynthesis protein [Nocardia vinacea]|uniref:carotenoid biosynthesis protein n=1 Tax=Nocardia vinacea TaxID=96468 RepID=UPI001FDF782C|nr:carotenoid biosynthesis protein [Nocardia vinacea]
MLAPVVPAVLLVLVQISYPLASGVGRDRVTVAVVLLSAGTALVHAVATRGIRYASGFVVIVSGLGLVAEIVGTATGFPFGCYAYAVGRSGPAVTGVPLVVALAWTGGLYPVWVVAGLLARRWARRVVLTAVGAVGWDLFLDPQMVADGQWTWCAAGRGLPGLAEIPYTNYLGWFAVSLVMALLLTGLDRAVGARGANTFAAPTAEHRLSTAETRTPTAERLLPTAQTHVPMAAARGAAASDMAAGTPALALGTPDSTSPQHKSREPISLISADTVVPVAVFMWTWLGSTLAHAVFLDLPYSAWYGCVGLGVLGVPLLVRSAAARRG